MTAALAFLILAGIAFIVVAPCFIVRLLYIGLEWVVCVIRHEMVMRPKERYYRM